MPLDGEKRMKKRDMSQKFLQLFSRIRRVGPIGLIRTMRASKAARACLESRNFEDLLVQANLLVALAPDDPESFSMKAQALAARGDRQGALACLGEGLLLHDRDLNLLVFARNLALRDGRLSETIDFGLRIAGITPGDLKNRRALARAFLASSDFENALAQANAIIAIAPEQAEGFILKAKALAALSRDEDAFASLREGLLVDEHPKLLTLARIHSSATGRLSETIEFGLRLARIAPQDQKNRIALARAFLASADFASLLVQADALIAIDPQHAEGYLLKAEALVALGDADAGLACLRDGLRINETNPELLGFARGILFSYRRFDEAIDLGLRMAVVARMQGRERAAMMEACRNAAQFEVSASVPGGTGPTTNIPFSEESVADWSSALAEHLELLLSRGDYRRARELLAVFPTFEDQPLSVVAVAARDRKLLRYPQKREAWERILDARPHDYEAHASLVRLALRERDDELLAMKIEGGRRALIVRPAPSTDPDGRGLLQAELAEAYFSQGEFEKSLGALMQAKVLRPTDPRISFARAAIKLEMGYMDESRADFLEGMTLAAERDGEIGPLLVHGLTRWAKVMASKKRPSAEIVMFTNFSRKISVHADLAPPTAGLIRATFSSLREHVLQDETVPITVMYDRGESPEEDLYEDSLRDFCVEVGAALVVNRRYGLRRQWLDAIERTKAEVVFFIEHDWLFRANSPPLATLLRAFEKSPEINYLRLNKRANIPFGIDDFVLPAGGSAAAELCFVSSFTNMPHLARRSFLEKVVKPLIRHSDHRTDSFNAGAGGVEDLITQAFRREIVKNGLAFSLRLFGTYIWGGPDAEARVLHIGY